jgi:hypothetical protein
MIAVPLSVPPTTELVTKAQLVARHPHLLSVGDGETAVPVSERGVGRPRCV